MRKQKLIILTVLLMAVIGLTAPSPKVEAADTVDCNIIRSLCQIASSVNYDICLLNGGMPTDCAYAEAVETINCMAAAGCGKPMPSKPGGN